MKRFTFLQFAALCLLLILPILYFVSNVHSQAPVEASDSVTEATFAPSSTLFSYQGQLLSAQGVPVTNAAIPMTFKLYTTATGGAACWTESRTGSNAVSVQGGRFNVLLGQITPIPHSCLSNNAYLELTVNGETLTPRELLTSVAFAVDARKASGDFSVEGNLEMNGNPIRNTAGIQVPFAILSDRSWQFEAVGTGNATETILRSLTGSKFFRFANPDGTPILSVRAAGTNASFVQVHENLNVDGNLTIGGSCSLTKAESDKVATVDSDCTGGSITSGAYIEANLQTVAEMRTERITRFSQGDLLCWDAKAEQLELCAIADSRLVMAVASVNGKPIVLGAEPIKVLGPVAAGDILVSSDVPGYAIVNNNPAPGTVIGQALESFAGESGLIKAMIRK